MKKDEVVIGRVYVIRDGRGDYRLVRIDKESHLGGWSATYLSTGRKTRIKSAMKLRRESHRMETLALEKGITFSEARTILWEATKARGRALAREWIDAPADQRITRVEAFLLKTTAEDGYLLEEVVDGRTAYQVAKEIVREEEANIRFSDGVSFNTRGEFRIEQRADGYYVVGEGVLIPVANREEGEEFIAKAVKKTETTPADGPLYP